MRMNQTRTVDGGRRGRQSGSSALPGWVMFLALLLVGGLAPARAQVDGGGVGMRPVGGAGITAKTVYANSGANLYAMKQAASAGTTIVVGPGTYSANITNLFKNGVNWHFMGPTLSYMDTPTNTSGAGIFDDRFTGAITSLVSGQLTIEYCTGTNIWVDPADCNFTGYNTNAVGPLVVTNAGSLVYWTADTRLKIAGVNGYCAALYVQNCATGTVFRTLNIEPLFGTNTTANITTNCPADPGTQITAVVNVAGIHWAQGTLDVGVDTSLTPGGYFLDCYGVKATDAYEMRVRANYADGKIYLVGSGPNWKVWADILELKRSNSDANPSAIDCYFAGSHYFRIQKISTGNGSAPSSGATINMSHPSGNPDGNSNLVVWVDIDKLAGSNAWARVSHGELRGRIGHFQQNGPKSTETGMIAVTNASALVSLSGETMECSGPSVGHGGGRTELSGYTIRSTNRDPVLVSGAGLKLNSVTIIPGLLATNSIRGVGAQNVNFYGNNFAKSNSVNITATVGTLNVDADVD